MLHIHTQLHTHAHAQELGAKALVYVQGVLLALIVLGDKAFEFVNIPTPAWCVVGRKR
jgi:small neutral amino acid transporter SnatA (MarC family)